MAVLFCSLGQAAFGDAIAFFYALDADLQAVKQRAHEFGRPVSVGTRKVCRLALGSHTIYAVKMGSGSVETALSAQALLARFPCDWAFSVGPAGALSDAAEAGKWYRVGRIVPWQRGRPDNEDGDRASWSIDWAILPAVENAGTWPCAGTVTVASGEAFIASTDERARLYDAFGAEVVDMNAYGLAAACRDHSVPLFMWKIVSDRADERASEDFRAFVNAYQGDGGHHLVSILERLPSRADRPMSYPAIRELLQDQKNSESFAQP